MNKGKHRHEAQKRLIYDSLPEYLRPNGTVDGAKLEADWFPNIEAHLFLSHSHADEDFAIVLSQLLYDKFKINTFIDSCVWGYCNDLLLNLDKNFCLTSDKKYYKYDLRNYTTGLVHMMLATALTKMIDRCECLFFLNTSNSIVLDPSQCETSSPWIYHELYQSKVICRRQRQPGQKMFYLGGN